MTLRKTYFLKFRRIDRQGTLRGGYIVPGSGSIGGLETDKPELPLLVIAKLIENTLSSPIRKKLFLENTSFRLKNTGSKTSKKLFRAPSQLGAWEYFSALPEKLFLPEALDEAAAIDSA